jgi:predicted alpha/beta superfamily hydrolase
MVNLLEGWFGWSRHLSALDGLSAECVPGVRGSARNRYKALKIKGFIRDSLSGEEGWRASGTRCGGGPDPTRFAACSMETDSFYMRPCKQRFPSRHSGHSSNTSFLPSAGVLNSALSALETLMLTIRFPSLIGAFLALCSGATYAAPAGTIAQTDGGPYVLPNTVVHTIRAAQLNRDYQVYVSLPAAYAAGGPPLPVVFVTDADYAFPLVRAIAARVGGHSKAIGPFVLVGLSYAMGDTATYSRNRDYTPTPSSEGATESDMPGHPPRYGEAENYRRFLVTDVLPQIARRYRVDWSRSVFVGHSYGSLLGTHILLQSPQMFSRYVLSSPSLWYDRKVMFTREKDYAATHKDMKADVFFAVGGLERPCGKGAATGGRCNKHVDMVADLRAFDAALRSRRYPGLRTQVHVYDGFDHLSVYPDMMTDALKWITSDR